MTACCCLRCVLCVCVVVVVVVDPFTFSKEVRWEGEEGGRERWEGEMGRRGDRRGEEIDGERK